MPRASKIKITAGIRKELDENFSYLIRTLSNAKDIDAFLKIFLSEEEKLMLAKRLMLHLMILRGFEAKEITAILGISKETLRKHQEVVTLSGELYTTIIAKIANRQKSKELWRKVEKALRPLELALSAKSNIQSRTKLLLGDFD